MVNPVSGSTPRPLDAVRAGETKDVPGTPRPAFAPDKPSTPAARLSALGPPIDLNRVGEIRAAIAQGTYTVDADRLAAAMIALDLSKADR